MNDLKQHYTDEQTGISYTLVGDHYLPDLLPPESENYSIGRFGRMRLDHLKHHHRVLYVDLLTSGKLYEHLNDIDEAANDRMELLSRQMAEREDVTERLKAEDQMLWVQRMNNICGRIEGIIREELIYS